MRTEGEILADVRRLASEYFAATGKPLGVTGEVAEYEAADKLGLDLAPPRTPGYDAVRPSTGEKIQVKGRRITGRTGRMPKIDLRHEFDRVLLVLLDHQYEPIETWEAGRSEVIERLTRPGSKARTERGQLGVSQFKSIARRVWP